MNINTKTKYNIDITSNFSKQYKKCMKQGKSERKFIEVVMKLANEEILEPKYKDHKLKDNKYYKDCRECHIEPDWLLIYQYQDNKLVLLLVGIGSHTELFD